MGLQPGDEFEIQLGYKHIHLKQIDDRKDNQLRSPEAVSA
jgi:hypothetical protein